MNTVTAMNLVSNSASSIFTKQDVLDILIRIESTPVEQQGKVITQNDMEEFIDYMSDQMRNLVYGQHQYGVVLPIINLRSGFNVIWSLFKDLSTFPYSI